MPPLGTLNIGFLNCISAYKPDKSFMYFPVTTRSEGLSLICDGDITTLEKIYSTNILDKSDV